MGGDLNLAALLWLSVALSLTEGTENPASMVISYCAANSGPANCSRPYV